jgi:ketosteroid isomerase-like protein
MVGHKTESIYRRYAELRTRSATEDAAAVRRADWDAVVRMFTTDAIRFPPIVAFVRGRYALTAAAPGSGPMTDRGNYD